MTTKLTLDGAMRYEVVLDPAGTEDPELVEVFTQYWDAAARPVGGPTRWSTPVSRVAGGSWGSETGAAAGVGGIATVVGRSCSACGGSLTLTSRSAFDQAQNDEPVRCRMCTAHFGERVERLQSPEARQRRETRRTAQDAAARARTEQDRVAAARVEAIQQRYGMRRAGAAPEPFGQTVAVQVATLAIVRRHMDGGVSVPLDEEDQRFAPETAADAFYDTVGSLLTIHPSTPAVAFEWASDAGPDAATFGDSLYPSQLRLYRDSDASAAAAAETLVEDLEASLDLQLLSGREQEDLILLARDLIAGEGIRYLEYRLSRYSLPAIAAQHRSRLMAVMRRAADRLPIDVIYYLAWGAASAATNLLESVRTSREKASTHALNRFERRVGELAENPDLHVESYGLVQDLPLTSLTRTVFYEVLQRGIIGVSVPDLRAGMPTPFDVQRRSLCADELPPVENAATTREALLATLAAQDGSRFRAALASIESDPFTECASRCSHAEANHLIRSILQKWDTLAKHSGARDASIAIVTLLPWLDYRDPELRERPSIVLTNRLATLLITAEDQRDATIL